MNDHRVKMNDTDDVYITKAQLAVRMNVSTRTIETWMHQRKLPFEKIGRTVRFHWRDVRDYFSSRSRAMAVGHDNLRPAEGCKARLQQLAKAIRLRSESKITGQARVDENDDQSPL